jgi:mannose-6-phosphate isomerase
MYLAIESNIKSFGFNIISKDFNRPWGGFLVIDENKTEEFFNKFFKNLDFNSLKFIGKLSPNFLVVKPNTRLSWQYHNRRAVIWKIFQGPARAIRSNSNLENEMEVLQEGDQIVLKEGERHRLIGLNDFCLIAEI